MVEATKLVKPRNSEKGEKNDTRESS